MSIRALRFSVVPVLALLVLACDGDAVDPASSGAVGEAGVEGTDLRLARGFSWVVFGPDTVTAEVADSPQARERGLMRRDHLEDGEGMLFVFEDEATRSFWMRDTYIPLDIAFLDRTQTIVDIRQMEPLSEELHHSSRPAMFALEVPMGWFEARGVAVGDRASIVFGPR